MKIEISNLLLVGILLAQIATLVLIYNSNVVEEKTDSLWGTFYFKRKKKKKKRKKKKKKKKKIIFYLKKKVFFFFLKKKPRNN